MSNLKSYPNINEIKLGNKPEEEKKIRDFYSTRGSSSDKCVLHVLKINSWRDQTKLGSINEFKKLLKKDIQNKKGIIMFDMDGVLNGYFENLPKENYYIPHDDQDPTSFEGIKLSTINYLLSLKKEYVLITNTSWQSFNFHEYIDHKGNIMPKVFDYYCSKAGNLIEYTHNNNLYSFIPSFGSKPAMYNGKSNVNRLIQDICKEEKEKNSSFKIIQFEDEWNGDYFSDILVIVDFNQTHSKSLEIKDDQNCQVFDHQIVLGLDNLNTIESKRFYDNHNHQTRTTTFGIKGQGVENWLKNNL